MSELTAIRDQMRQIIEETRREGVDGWPNALSDIADRVTALIDQQEKNSARQQDALTTLQAEHNKLEAHLEQMLNHPVHGIDGLEREMLAEHQRAEAAEAAVLALQQQIEAKWQPIETPPPSARTVLLTNGCNVSSGYFAATDRMPRWHDETLQAYGEPATHWQSLPAAPIVAQAEEAHE